MVWFRRTRNLKRFILRKPIGIIHLTFADKLPIVREPVPFIKRQVLPQPEFSLLELYQKSQRLINSGRVKGLLIDLQRYEGNYATTESLIDVINLWKKHNLPVWIYSNQYSFADYYLASYADEIFLTPGGTLNTIGVSFTVSYYKNYFEDKGLEVDVAQVTPYKSALNSLKYETMPDEQRKNLNWLGDGIFDQIVDAVAQNRDKSRDEVLAMIDNSPLTDEIAVEQNWVDDIRAASRVREIVDQQVNAEVTSFKEALGRISIPKKPKPNIAMIPVIGTIIDGESSNNDFPIPIPIIGDRNAGDRTVSQMIRTVRKKDNIEAAVLVVDSPGGSATASEVMLQELKELSKKIPVVVYFHDVAASGGYFVSMASDYIIAQPLTITASIGVINAKFSTDGLFEKRDVNRVTIKRGKNSTIMGSVGSWNEEQREIIERSMFRIYDIFKEHVINNRVIDHEKLDDLAGGRVFLGHQAKKHNLVDELGGLQSAIDKAAELADINTPEAAIIVAEKSPHPPDRLPLPDVLMKKISSMSGKNQLLPYYIIDPLFL